MTIPYALYIYYIVCFVLLQINSVLMGKIQDFWPSLDESAIRKRDKEMARKDKYDTKFLGVNTQALET